MTRKDYMEVAGVLRLTMPEDKASLKYEQWVDDVIAIAYTCYNENGRDIFYDACGVNLG